MGISTKVAKHIVMNADVRRPSKKLIIATWDKQPRLAVLYEDVDPPVIVSVLFRTREKYARKGKSFTTVHGGD